MGARAWADMSHLTYIRAPDWLHASEEQHALMSLDPTPLGIHPSWQVAHSNSLIACPQSQACQCQVMLGDNKFLEARVTQVLMSLSWYYLSQTDTTSNSSSLSVSFSVSVSPAHILLWLARERAEAGREATRPASKLRLSFNAKPFTIV